MFRPFHWTLWLVLAAVALFLAVLIWVEERRHGMRLVTSVFLSYSASLPGAEPYTPSRNGRRPGPSLA